MYKLELKIPPVILMLGVGFLMWLASLILPGIQLPDYLRLTCAVALSIAGVFFAVTGVYAFKQTQTTLDPTTPTNASSLVTVGVYKRTRNPMYVGLFFFLLSWGMFLSNIYSLVLSLGFVLYMNRFQIRPEEKALTTIFGAAFIDYKQRVRRWL
jgi:protein-S-isoprenylcysteine O-methyltransferase Ste14